jgi:hypothetical protein
MKYQFFDWHSTGYDRETKGNIKIKAETIEESLIKLNLSDSRNSCLSIILNKQEATGIESALHSAISGCKCNIQI